MQKDKSPGHDGWPVEYFNGIMDLCEMDIQVVIEESW